MAKGAAPSFSLTNPKIEVSVQYTCNVVQRSSYAMLQQNHHSSYQVAHEP